MLYCTVFAFSKGHTKIKIITICINTVITAVCLKRICTVGKYIFIFIFIILSLEIQFINIKTNKIFYCVCLKKIVFFYFFSAKRFHYWKSNV